jgi:hypothetical protein
MKRSTFLQLVILFVLFGLTSLAHAQAGQVYEVSVSSSAGGSFCDCFRFSSESPGCLTIDGLGKGQIYGPTSSGGWQSTYIVRSNVCGVNEHSRPRAFGISFHGTVVTDQILGEAINDSGELFTFSGLENPACSLSSCSVTASSKSLSNSNPRKNWSAKPK